MLHSLTLNGTTNDLLRHPGQPPDMSFVFLAIICCWKPKPKRSSPARFSKVEGSRRSSFSWQASRPEAPLCCPETLH